MSPGLRLLAAIAVICFLVLAGLLGGLQDLQPGFVEDPALAAELAERVLPIEPLGGAQPYKAMDFRERFDMAAVYLRSPDTGSGQTWMLLTSMPPTDFDADGELDRGMRKEWDYDGLEASGPATTYPLRFRGQALTAEGQEFRAADGRARRQLIVPLDWGGRMVFVAVHGPSDVVTVPALQAALDATEGDAVPLLPPAPDDADATADQDEEAATAGQDEEAAE